MNAEIEKVIKQINLTSGTNKSTIYNSHLYWSQKPYNICDILISNLSNAGDIVCDPFMGSGVSIIQAMQNNIDRRAIGIEINDYPIYLVRTLLEKYDLVLVKSEIDKIKSKIEVLNNIVYGTFCCKCGNEVIVEKSMFEYVGDFKKITNSYYTCKKCKNQNTIVDDNSKIGFYKYDKCETFNFMDINLIPNSRIAVKDGETLYDIFTSRNIKAIDLILETIKGTTYYDLYRYALLGIMHLCKITDPKSSSQWPLWTPNKNCIEKNVFNLFIKSLKKMYEAIVSVDLLVNKDRKEVKNFCDLDKSSYMIIKEGTQFVDSEIIPDNSVDLIITDPPYMGQVIYSEYMQLYMPVLKNKIEYDKEIIVVRTKERIKTEKEYFDDLKKAFSQMSRFLKENKYMCLYFHDVNLKTWEKLIDITEECGLKFEGLTHVNKGQSTLKNIVSPKKSLNGDAILFFKKTKIEKKENKILNEIMCKNIALGIISSNGGSCSTAKLYDGGVLEYIIESGMLKDAARKYGDLTEIFIKDLIWNKNGLWTIK